MLSNNDSGPNLHDSLYETGHFFEELSFLDKKKNFFISWDICDK